LAIAIARRILRLRLAAQGEHDQQAEQGPCRRRAQTPSVTRPSSSHCSPSPFKKSAGTRSDRPTQAVLEGYVFFMPGRSNFPEGPAGASQKLDLSPFLSEAGFGLFVQQVGNALLDDLLTVLLAALHTVAEPCQFILDAAQ
jgi:hypothetical protein